MLPVLIEPLRQSEDHSRFDHRAIGAHHEVVQLVTRLPAAIASHVFKNPFVVTSATRAPLRSSTALVATVDPWTTSETASLPTNSAMPEKDGARRDRPASTVHLVHRESARIEAHQIGEGAAEYLRRFRIICPFCFRDAYPPAPSHSEMSCLIYPPRAQDRPHSPEGHETPRGCRACFAETPRY